MAISVEPVVGATWITPRVLVLLAALSALVGSYVRLLYKRAIRRI